MCFDAKRARSVDENAGMLGCNDRFDDSSKIVDIRQSFDAEQNIVKAGFAG